MNRTLSRAVGLGLVMAISSVALPAPAQEVAGQEQASPSAQNTNSPPVNLPDSPGAVNARSSGGGQSSATDSSAQVSQTTQPSGTAVAPPVRVSGGAASKPAGVAIAPPKQRQIRSWLIKFGFIAGAGAALGTVAALSAASPSRVPGSTGR
jgi:hypothetical protein